MRLCCGASANAKCEQKYCQHAGHFGIVHASKGTPVVPARRLVTTNL